MSRFRNTKTNVVVSVDDSKDHRFGLGWKPADEPDQAGYGSLKVAELQAEIERRNQDREPDKQLPAEGKKADLIAALEADDQASGGAHSAPGE